MTSTSTAPMMGTKQAQSRATTRCQHGPTDHSTNGRRLARRRVRHAEAAALRNYDPTTEED